MSAETKTITLRAKYEGDLRGLNDDIAKLKSIGRNLQANNPFRIRPTLDLGGIRADAQRAAKEFNSAFKSAMGKGVTPGSTVSRGGIIIPASASVEMKKFQGVAGSAFKQITTDGDKVIKTFAQLEKGIQQVTSKRKDKGGAIKTSVTQIDTSPIANFKAQLAAVEREFAGKLGAAKGSKGDVASLLEQKQKRIAAVLNGQGLESVKNLPVFTAAEKSLDRLEERIASTRGNQNRANVKQSRGVRIDSLKDGLLGIDTATAARIGAAKGNKGDVATILAEKRQLIQAELAKFADIANSPAYKQAQKAINALDKGVAQAQPTQSARTKNDARKDFNRRTDNFISRQNNGLNRNQIKASKEDEATARLIQNRAVREAEINRILNERERILAKQVAQYRQLEQAANKKGFTEAGGRYRNAANSIEGQLNQVRLDRTRENGAAARVDSEADLNRRLQSLVQYNKVMRERLKLEEQAANKLPNRSIREARLQDIQARRGNLLNSTQSGVSAIEREAASRGLNGTRATARANLTGLQATGIADMRRLAGATNQSGHAFNFHSNALLRNAATFTKWYIPAQAAMKTLQGFGAGISGAIDAQRTFKILGATFRGTTEDAKLLADQTLLLAAANGRDVDEAAQAAVAWSRLGLTRNQILVATETSLRAANVAEISAAEATAYLTANYKAFGQTIADIPATLDYINSLSNKSAVAPKEIFQGLARSASIAKSAGIEFETLASIIATVSEVTQRPGAESGNAVKTIISRLNRPKVTADLKDQFGLDFSTINGDVQNATQILTKLAAVYPTLNTFEQGRLKNIVAGANQGNRFAIIMEHWTETLIAQAQAGLDANSAMRENANILDSVSSKLASVETAWTRLFHTLGEAGAFEVVTRMLAGMSDGVNQLGSSIKSVSGEIGRISGKSSKEVTDIAGTVLQKGISALPAPLSVPAGILLSNYNRGKSLENPRIQDSKAATTRIAKLAQESLQAQNRVKSLNAGDQAFQVMASQFGTPGVPNKTIIEQFDKAIPVLSALPGGQANVASARKRIRPLLESGNVEGGRRALSQTAAELYVGKEKEFASSEEQRTKSLKTTEEAIAATTRESQQLNSELAASEPGEAQDKLTLKLYETEQALKEQQNSLTTLQQKFEKPIADPLASHKETLDAYLADLTAISAAYSELLTTFGSSGFADLDAKFKLGGARLEGDLLDQTIRKTQVENDRLDTTDPDGKKSRDLVLNSFQDKLTDIRAATAEAERKIELERQTANLRTTYDDARTSTGSSFARFETGRSDGEKLSNRTAGIFREIGDDIANPNLGLGNANRDAAELGSLTERLAQGKAGIASMEDRMNRALAERVNLEGDIAEQNRKQTEELSKQLQLASREDQLRAAASAAFLRNSGQKQYSGEQFQFFSQETRGAISNYAPRSVQGLDDNEREQADSRSKLNEEIRNLGRDISSARRIFDNLRPQAETKAGGLYDPKNPFDSKGTTGDQLLKSNKDEIRLNLNTGPINIQIDFSKHVAGLVDVLQGRFDAATTATLSEVKRMLAGNAAPNTSAAAGVQ